MRLTLARLRKKGDPFGAVQICPSIRCRKDRLPLGAIVIRQKQDGKRKRLARYVKVRMDGPQQKRWKPYGRWWWEKHRGPIPPGKIIIHKDRDELNDRPENLMLGTPGTKLKIAHQNRAWSRAQHERAKAGCAEFNRLTGKLHRLREVLPDYWYPVLDNAGLILNVPFRRLKPMLKYFGADVSNWPANGRSAKIVSRLVDVIGIRPARGRDLDKGILQTYSRVDPDLKIGSGKTRLSDEEERRIEVLQETRVWKLAVEAARKDLRDRA